MFWPALTQFDSFLSGDLAWFINPLFKDFKWVVKIYNFGGVMPISDLIPLQLIFKLGFVHLPPIFFQVFYMLLLHLALFLSFYVFTLYYFKRGIFLPALWYAVNTFLLTSFFGDRLLPVCVVLPLGFMLYHMLLFNRNASSMVLLPLVTLLFSGSFINPPIVFPFFLILVVYLIYYVFMLRKLVNPVRLIGVHSLAILLFVLLSFWSLSTLVPYMFSQADATASVNTFRATGSGYLFDHFRFLGKWSWYTGHFLKPYYTYAENYYSLPLLFSTFTLSLTSLFLFFRGMKKNLYGHYRRIDSVFFFLLFLLGLFLSSGSKHLMGKVFSSIYNTSRYFWIFREPYAKFMTISAFALPVLLSYGLCALDPPKLRFRYGKVFRISLLLLIIFSSYPLFTGRVIKTYWNGSMRSSLVKIPAYWERMSSLGFSERVSRTLTTPYTRYGSVYNWIHGVSPSVDIARFLLEPTIVSGVSFPVQYSDFIVNSYHNYSYNLADATELLGFLNIRHLLQENDVDWRYASSRTLDPKRMGKIIESMDLEKIEEFGDFTQDYLTQIPNEEPDDSLRNEMYVKLLGEPGLELYKVPDKYYVPKFYVPTQTNHVSGDFDELLRLYSEENTVREPVYYFNSEDYPQTTFAKRPTPHRAFALGQLDKPRINFSRLFWHEGWGLPEVSVNPGDFKYKLVLLKERVEILRARGYLEKADLHVWFASKRIDEIYRFELAGEDLENALENFQNHLEASMHLLEEDPVLEEDAENYETYWGMVEKVLMYSQHNISVLSDYPKVSTETVDSLVERYRQFYLWIEANNNYACKETSLPCYVFEVPYAGDYELLPGNETLSLEDGSYSRNISLDHPVLKGLDVLSLDALSPTVAVPDWDSTKSYRVSFDYKILNSSVEVGVLEEQWDYGVIGDEIGKVDWAKVKQGSFPLKRERTQEQVLNSSQICFEEGEVCYSRFEMIIEPSRNSVKGSVYFKFPLEQDFTKKIEIKNLKIEEYSEPFVYLRSMETLPAKEQVPEITFEKVNPTKYIVSVSNANEPFDLVFIESFHKGWKLYPANTIDGTSFSDRFFEFASFIGHVLTDRFNLHIDTKSGMFLDSSTFDTWGKQSLSSDRHFVANGFANSWRINPELLDGGEGTFVVEFWYQRLFYVGIFVSGSTFVLACLYLVYMVIRSIYVRFAKR